MSLRISLCLQHQADKASTPDPSLVGFSEGPESFSKLRVSIADFRQLFSWAMERHPPGKKAFEQAGPYLAFLEQADQDVVFLEDVMDEGLGAVAEAIGIRE